MSTEQPDLSSFATDDTPALHEEALADRGAEYVPSETATASAPQQADENVCHNCGADVEPKIARVVGDNNGCIPVCSEPECRKDAIGAGVNEHEYQETTRLVRAYRSKNVGGIGE